MQVGNTSAARQQIKRGKQIALRALKREKAKVDADENRYADWVGTEGAKVLQTITDDGQRLVDSTHLAPLPNTSQRVVALIPSSHGPEV